MMMAITTAVRRRNPALHFFIATTNPDADALAASIGFESLRIWGGPLMPFKFLRRLMEVNPSVGLVTGADIMDGHYSPVMSLRMIIAADLLARYGAKTAFVGFSMNEQPTSLVKYAFRQLDHRVKVNLRDPLSWERYRKIAGRDGSLVADSAFLLEPAAVLTDEHATTVAWMRLQQSQGRVVLALNMHPMLFSQTEASASIERLIESTISTMRDLTSKHSLSWVLLPHDNRSASGDMSTLSDLYGRFDETLRMHSRLVEAPPRAAEIKAMLANADGAITGRMHLAIAALGQSVPVMTFAYQDKFAGLLQHFNMPNWLVLDAKASTKADFLSRQVEKFVLELPELKKLAQEMLPKVTEAAESTFEGVV